jgi:hypothetical protein
MQSPQPRSLQFSLRGLLAFALAVNVLAWLMATLGPAMGALAVPLLIAADLCRRRVQQLADRDGSARRLAWTVAGVLFATAAVAGLIRMLS